MFSYHLTQNPVLTLQNRVYKKSKRHDLKVLLTLSTPKTVTESFSPKTHTNIFISKQSSMYFKRLSNET